MIWLGTLLFALTFVATVLVLVPRWILGPEGRARLAARYEERTLARRFGAEYAAYRAAVGRWVPRLRPYEHRAPAR